jgi:NADH-quinone oxidoreductase subunit L
MFLACGVAAFSAGIFHLMTHAFFKGLLFLAAGSVIHAVGGEQDMRKMGGLRKKIPWTFWTMTIATFAIAGFPPLAGFFSKDEILWRAYSSPQGSWVYWLVGLITAFITSFYMFRLWFMTFFGEYRGAADASHGPEASRMGASAPPGYGHGRIHESPKVMLAPLVILAVLSLGGGWIGSARFQSFLSPVFLGHAETKALLASSEVEAKIIEMERLEFALMLTSVAAAGLGLLLAWLLYKRQPELPDRIAGSIHSLYVAVASKYWIDDLYGWIFVKPLIAVSGIVFWRGIDQGVIDATLDGSAATARELSDNVRHMQSGNVRSYAGWVAIGATAVIVYMVWVGTR